MKRSNRLVILVGVLLAILAFVGIVILLNQAGPDTVAPEERTGRVLVATRDIEIGEPVTPDDVEMREVPLDAVQATAMSDPSQVGGRPSLFFIPSGSQVTQEAIGLGISAGEDIASQLQAGEKAIAIRVDPQTGANFLIRQGNRVDFVISVNMDVLQETADSIANDDPEAAPRFESVTGLEAVPTVKTVLQNKRVLYVSGTRFSQPPPATEDGEQQPAPQQPTLESIIIIFAGTDQDAEIVKFVQRDHSELSSERTELATSITAVLRATDDEAIEQTTGITLDVLVEDYGLRIPGIVETLGETGP